MSASAEQLAEMRAVNAAVNAIPYEALPGRGEPPDWWTDIPASGRSWVCRDYTQKKADELKLEGFDPHSLTVVLCWTEPFSAEPGLPQVREYHAILCVGFDDEVWLLDSRAQDIYQPKTKPYDYLWDRQQIPGATGFRSIVDTGPV